jgi:FKBP-type peptidyl-prolyl cis-trans isomerase (trigger factor)
MDGAAPRLSWKATVPLRPTVDAGDYQSIRVLWEEPKASEEQIRQRLESIRLQATPFEPVERPVETGDMLTLDIVAVAHDVLMPLEGQEGVTAPGDLTFMDERSWNFRLVSGTLFPAPGFDEQAAGKKQQTHSSGAAGRCEERGMGADLCHLVSGSRECTQPVAGCPVEFCASCSGGLGAVG